MPRRAIVTAMAERVRITFADLGKRYDARVVFRGVSGEARPGEVLVVTGPNGSGKSTLVQILCGLVRPTRGSLRYLDDGGTEIPREAWRTQIGVVAPAMAVYEELTATENLHFYARVRGMGNAAERCRQCLEMVGLDPGRITPVRGFSTGMQQRLKIAQALLHDPSVLFLDEPGSNLDPTGQDWLEGLVRGAAAQGKTVILATNDRQEMSWGSRGVTLAG
jgi:heme exporter protein A